MALVVGDQLCRKPVDVAGLFCVVRPGNAAVSRHGRPSERCRALQEPLNAQVGDVVGAAHRDDFVAHLVGLQASAAVECEVERVEHLGTADELGALGFGVRASKPERACMGAWLRGACERGVPGVDAQAQFGGERGGYVRAGHRGGGGESCDGWCFVVVVHADHHKASTRARGDAGRWR